MCVRSQSWMPRSNRAIPEEVTVAFAPGLLPGVVHLDGIAVGEPLVELRLHRVVPVVRAVAEVVDALGPSVGAPKAKVRRRPVRKERPPLVAGHAWETLERGVVHVHARSIAGKDVATPIADIPHFHRHRVGELPLHGDVERVHRRRPLLPGQRPGEDAVGQRELSAGRHVRKHRGGRSLREVERRVEVLGTAQLLGRQDRQVLRDAVTEQRAEHADVVGAPVAATDHRLLVDLVRGAQPRRPVQAVLGVAGQVHVSDAADVDEARVEVEPAAVAGSLTVCGLMTSRRRP